MKRKANKRKGKTSFHPQHYRVEMSLRDDFFRMLKFYPFPPFYGMMLIKSCRTEKEKRHCETVSKAQRRALERNFKFTTDSQTNLFNLCETIELEQTFTSEIESRCSSCSSFTLTRTLKHNSEENFL